MKVAGYIRVSGESQVEGTSLASQEDSIKKYCRENNMELVGVYREEGVSGSKDICDRPALNSLIAASTREEFSAVLVKRWDRLSRTVLQSLLVEQKLKEHGVDIIVIDQNTEGLDEDTSEFIRNILASFSQFEKSLTVKKMNTGKERKFRNPKGVICGPAAYGYKQTGKRGNRIIVEDEKEQAVIKMIKSLRRKKISYWKIADILNGESENPITGEKETYPPRRSEKWFAQTVKNAITSNHTQGKVSYKGEVRKLSS